MTSALRRGVRLFGNLQQGLRILPSRASSFDEEGDVGNLKTTVNILNEEQDQGIFFSSYSNVGFRLSTGIRVMGPCVVFPKSILHWNVRGVEHINDQSLSLFTVLEPKLDILIIGVGEQENLGVFNTDIIRYLKTNKVNVEILATAQALTTFNFLNSERRYVAGAFIPPSYIEDHQDEDELYHSVVLAEGDVAEKHGDYFIDEPKGPPDLPTPPTSKERQQALQSIRKYVTDGDKPKLEKGPTKRDPNKYQDY